MMTFFKKSIFRKIKSIIFINVIIHVFLRPLKNKLILFLYGKYNVKFYPKIIQNKIKNIIINITLKKSILIKLNLSTII